jgi:hypothetical protein
MSSKPNDLTNQSREYPPPDTEWAGSPNPFSDTEYRKGQGVKISATYCRFNN